MMPSLPSVQKDPGIVEDLRAMLAYYRALGIESLDVELPKTEMPLDNLRSEIGECARCKLSKHRKSLVFGEGNPEARLMFIGEAPGREEDLQGRPFVGDPEEDEVASCRSFIERQIALIGPEVIVTLGRIALQTLMEDPGLKITQVRGHFTEFRGVPVMPTFHPAYLLRNPKDKWLTWADMQRVMKKLGLE
jgi:uracil-DNA glycosylase